MSKMVRLLAVLVVVGSLAGCAFPGGSVITGSGRTTTNDYDFSDFTKIDVGSAFQVDLTQGNDYAVSVTVDDNIVEYLDVRVEGDTLRIGLKPSMSLGFRNMTLRAQITMPDVQGINLSGATRTQMSGFSNSKPVDVEVSGASQLRGDITSGDMRMRASGASQVELNGSTGTLDVDASGASTIRLENFKSQNTRVQASGASNVTVNASGRLTGEASGASSVHYVGNPASVQVDTSGASSVKQQ